MIDYIKRSDVMALAGLGVVVGNMTNVDYVNAIREIPAAHVRPVSGHWIFCGDRKYKYGGRGSDAKKIFGTEWRTMETCSCSECRSCVMHDDSIWYSYCPHCGAFMGEAPNG